MSEVVPIGPELETALTIFFQHIDEDVSKHFHPHPLTADEARRIARYQGRDVYKALVENGRIVGYGMLRGWDAGYDVPSLGIAILPDRRGLGLGCYLMHVLHEAARNRGATKVRLKVYPDNASALSLYRSLGYQFDQMEAGQLVGFLDLTRA